MITAFHTKLNHNQQLMKKKKFLIVEDYTDISIWDTLIMQAMLALKSKPKGWSRPENTLPEGDWTLACGFYSMATDAAYKNFWVRKPSFQELPVVFVVNPDGSVEEQCNVTADQAAEFINARI
jgi:hypothetical protein